MYRYCFGLLCCLLSCVSQGQALSSAATAVDANLLQLIPNPVLRLPSTTTLSGTATWIAGSTHESGDLILRVSSSGGVEEDWKLKSVGHTFKLGGFGESRNCQSTDTNGKVSNPGSLACIRAVPWFAPWLAYKISSGGYGVPLDTTTADDKTAGLKRWTFTTAIPDRDSDRPFVQKLRAETRSRSAVQVLYDTQTQLPTRMEFAEYPNSDPAQKIDVYVLFSDYRDEQGMMLPHRIQRYVQGTLQLDFQVASVSTN